MFVCLMFSLYTVTVFTFLSTFFVVFKGHLSVFTSFSSFIFCMFISLLNLSVCLSVLVLPLSGQRSVITTLSSLFSCFAGF